MTSTKKLLLTRPNHDPVTNYLYFWSKAVIDEAYKKGITVLDLEGTKATSQNFSSYIKRNEPNFMFLNGHGAKDAVGGFNDEVLLDVNNCASLIIGKILYVRSCKAGAVLGPESVSMGAIAFIGYNQSYWLVVSKNSSTRPLLDLVARLFLEPSNLVPISLIKGNDVNESYQKSQKSMYKNFRYMISSKASSEERGAAPFLYSNYTSQVVYGDKKAKI